MCTSLVGEKPNVMMMMMMMIVIIGHSVALDSL